MDVLYHYCSNDAFLSIIKQGTIRLSSLSLSNDSMEGKLVRKLMAEWASKKIKKESDRQEFQTDLESLNDLYDGLGFCLSQDGDLLSQWRGYADDGRGVSIGFTKNYLNILAKNSHSNRFPRFELKKVEYRQKQQREMIWTTFDNLNDLISKNVYNNPLVYDVTATVSPDLDESDNVSAATDNEMTYLKNLFSLTHKMFVVKPSGFREEREWRLIAPYHILTFGSDCLYRVSKRGVAPYCDIDLAHQGDDRRIHEIILGPKNSTPTHVIEGALRAKGFNDTGIKNSKLSYR